MRRRWLFVMLAALVFGGTFAQPEGQETRVVEIDGTRVQYHVVTPPGFVPGGVYPVLLVLPPAGGRPSDANEVLDAYFRDEGRDAGWVIIGAIAPYNSTTRLSRLFHLGGEDLIPPLLDIISNDVTFEGGKVHVAGISNGGAGAFRVATLYPDLVQSVLVLPGSAREEDLARLDALRGIPVRMYMGEHEDASSAERIETTFAALIEAGVEADLIVVPGDGHRITSLSGEQIFEWLNEQRP